MPGIVGMIGPQPTEVRNKITKQMMESLRHDPSYLYGAVSVPECNASVAWIALPGSMGSSPLIEGPDGITCLLSGECWARSGAHKKSGVPAIVSAYRSNSNAFVGELEGLFSGVLLDPSRASVLLFNDRYAGERLYIYEKDGATYFATEAKALLRVLPELRQWDEDGVAQFLKYGSTHRGRTLFRGLRSLDGGSFLTFEHGNVHCGQYFDPSHWENLKPLSAKEFEGRLSDRFPQLLEKYLRSHDNIGISITGGLDTRMIMASLPPGGVEGICYTYAGLEGLTADARIGAKVAEVCGMHHEVLRIEQAFIKDFVDHIDRTTYLTDGCAGPLQAHEIHLSKLAAQLSQTRVTGNYGSEVLRDMSTLSPNCVSTEILSRHMQRRVERLNVAWPQHLVTKTVFAEIPYHLFGRLAAARTQLVVRTPYLDTELVRLAYQAPAQARRSSASARRIISLGSPELSRIRTDQGLRPAGPDVLAPIHRTRSRVTFKLDYWHKEGLPSALTALSPGFDRLARAGLLGQHKYLPYRSWFAGPMYDDILAMINDPSVRHASFWDEQSIESMYEEHVNGRKNRLNEIHAVLLLGSVERTLMSGVPCDVF